MLIHLTSLHYLQTLFLPFYYQTSQSASLAITYKTTRGCLTITRLWPTLTGIQKVTSRTDRQALPCRWVRATSGTMCLMTGTSSSSVKSGHRWKTNVLMSSFITTAIYNVNINGQQYTCICITGNVERADWFILYCVFIGSYNKS